ncbi:Spherulation-specific family 4-domain-containing protein [Coniella lustricola]|uniref:Spherulation-specific family 4-domain-containing protein n=1 Tax=Coniella lustricola TaxID=2025994 RepID=A0A2T3AIG2_9PEZI|nr:Spherulation-specific family 4-domain-containing protein [Coniella lustricola]
MRGFPSLVAQAARAAGWLRLLPLLLLLLLVAQPSAARTDVMVPLYVYPGSQSYTNPNWQAAVDAIKANPGLHFYIIVNPNNGPLNTSDPSGLNEGYCNVANDSYIEHGCNRDWTTHLATINELPNAQTLGYVWTRYGARAVGDIKADIAEWAAWETAPTWEDGQSVNITIHGLWFDEVGTGSGNYSVYSELTSYANETFAAAAKTRKKKKDKNVAYSVVLNAGSVPNATYEAQLFDMASAVVTKETCFTSDPAASGVEGDCPEPYEPFDYTALTAGNGLPHDEAYNSRAVIIVHQFVGPPNATTATLQEQIDGVVSLGVHSTYFTSGSYHNTTAEPATVGNVGEMVRIATGANATSAAPRLGFGEQHGGSSWMSWTAAFVVFWSLYSFC